MQHDARPAQPLQGSGARGNRPRPMTAKEGRRGKAPLWTPAPTIWPRSLMSSAPNDVQPGAGRQQAAQLDANSLLVEEPAIGSGTDYLPSIVD